MSPECDAKNVCKTVSRSREPSRGRRYCERSIETMPREKEREKQRQQFYSIREIFHRRVATLPSRDLQTFFVSLENTTVTAPLNVPR